MGFTQIGAEDEEKRSNRDGLRGLEQRVVVEVRKEGSDARCGKQSR